jgi:hypothetical protein
VSSVDGKDHRVLSTTKFKRVLGASQDGETLYVARILPDDGGWEREGSALLDLSSGALEYLWPEEEYAKPIYFNFQQIRLPDGTQRILYYLTGRGVQPSVIWMGDPESRQAEAIWTVEHGSTWPSSDSEIKYDSPVDILWSSKSNHEFIYSAGHDVWRVNLETGKEKLIWETSYRNLLTWTTKGIVTWSKDEGIIQLLDESGEVQGEIRLSEPRS